MVPGDSTLLSLSTSSVLFDWLLYRGRFHFFEYWKTYSLIKPVIICFCSMRTSSYKVFNLVQYDCHGQCLTVACWPYVAVQIVLVQWFSTCELHPLVGHEDALCELQTLSQ